ncbi:hypothetical protein F5888DRAFT_914801 [Russula emetica]|nr:hypothetical protein F5888DRAFT_914801 [Russula emetica]
MTRTRQWARSLCTGRELIRQVIVTISGMGQHASASIWAPVAPSRGGRKLRRLLIAVPFALVSFPHRQLSLSSPRSIMSTAPSTSTSHSNFVAIFNAALESYKRKTKKDLAKHPLLSSLQSCDSPEAVLTVLRDQIPAFNQSQNQDDGLTKWVIPTVNVLYTFSATVGQGVGLAFPPANAIFAGIGVLLSMRALAETGLSTS